MSSNQGNIIYLCQIIWIVSRREKLYKNEIFFIAVFQEM
jgi:hypothetical protein